MSEPHVFTLSIMTNEEIHNKLITLLKKLGLQYDVSQDPNIIKIPAHTWALSSLIIFFEEQKGAIQGDLIFPDGKKYSLDENGISQMRGEFLQHINSTSVQGNAQETQNDWVQILRELLRDPDSTTRLVREVTYSMRGDPTERKQQIGQVTSVTISILIILSIIIIATSYLTWVGKMSGDATGFLFGTILGSAFTFLQRYLTTKETD